MTKILVVEDEESFSDPLSYLLEKEGFRVVTMADGELAVREFDRAGADLVLLDLQLPGVGGFEVCRQLRSRSAVPIIMLTARGEEIDKVLGLEQGADDYVTKPYASRELIARIRAVLRRPGRDSLADEAVVLDVPPVRVDVARHTVTVAGQRVDVPLREFELLEVLLRQAGRVVSRKDLIEQVWGRSDEGETKTLDVHIKRLRSKVEPDPSRPRHLLTVRGLGYKFEP